MGPPEEVRGGFRMNRGLGSGGGVVTGCGGVGEAVVGGVVWLGLLVRRTVLPWRSWLLWAPCQARGIGGGKGTCGGGGEGYGRRCWLGLRSGPRVKHGASDRGGGEGGMAAAGRGWWRGGGRGAGPRMNRGLGSGGGSSDGVWRSWRSGGWWGRVAGVVAGADGVALAELVALGPVSSTGHRMGEGCGRERVP